MNACVTIRKAKTEKYVCVLHRGGLKRTNCLETFKCQYAVTLHENSPRTPSCQTVYEICLQKTLFCMYICILASRLKNTV